MEIEPPADTEILFLVPEFQSDSDVRTNSVEVALDCSGFLRLDLTKKVPEAKGSLYT